MKLYTILFSLLFALCADSLVTAKAQAVDVNDSLALVDLYNSTNGPEWNFNTNWLHGPVITWSGVALTGTRVSTLYLQYNNLTGFIPASIGNLTKLSTLNLHGNNLTGIIPSSVGNLTNLTIFTGYNNQLSGTIPFSIGNLVNLIDLELYGNQLTGTIPSSIGNLTRLRFLELHQNQLSGIIPATLGKLKNLEYLELFSNKLSGNIPSFIGNIEKLKTLTLYNNRLTGDIPLSVINLKKLFAVNVSNNLLSQSSNYNYPFSDTLYKNVDVSDNHSNFNGLEFIAKNIRFNKYGPQANLPVHINGNTLSVSAGGTLSNNTYTWYKVGEGRRDVITGDSTFHPRQSGRFFAEVSNAIATQLVLTTDKIDYTAPGEVNSEAITANSNSLKNTATHFLVYPNPAKNRVQVQIKGTADIIVTSTAGKVVLTKTINNNGVININALIDGIYYLQNKATGEMQKIAVLH